MSANSNNGKVIKATVQDVFVTDRTGSTRNPIKGVLVREGETVYFVLGSCWGYLGKRTRIEWLELTGLKRRQEIVWENFIEMMNDGRLIWE